MNDAPADRPDEVAVDLGLTESADNDPLLTAVLEIERHVAGAGWDQPARLYALVDTVSLIQTQDGLAEMLGIEGEPAPGTLTPIEQELKADDQLEEVLTTILWPNTVDGCAAVMERLVLPPEADAELPEDAAEAVEFAQNHPLRQEIRIVAAVTRAGGRQSAMRFRAHDNDAAVVDGTELVPGLLDLLAMTFDEVGLDGDEDATASEGEQS